MNSELYDRYRQSYRDLELFPLLTAEQIEAFRVDYGEDTLARLEQAIDASPPTGKIIFAGHRGCGKSTLLARLRREMRQSFFVAFFSIADLIEMSDVDHVNILYAVALKLLSEATRQQIPIPSTTQAALLNWMTTTESQITTQDIQQEIGVGGDFFKILSAKLKNEATFRKEIRKTFERNVTDLAKQADTIAAYIKTATGKETLVVIDDLDKLDLGLVHNIYRDNINALFAHKFRIIFTIPISAIRNTELLAVLQSAASRIQLMAVSKFYKQRDSHKPDAVPSEKAVYPLHEALKKRIPEALVEPDTARQIVLKSGGVIRELVRIARECCNECMLRLRLEPDRAEVQIDAEILTAALKNLRNEFARSLGQNRFDILVATYNNWNPPDAESQEFLSLLHGLYVLEYENDDLWYDVHPIVIDLLKRKQLISN